ncbi:MAG: DNA primase [Muribaculaceae bacterium]|nr:DNA primase [Muribaculaceae bacterium]
MKHGNKHSSYRIDHATVQRIMDAADIVDVVSDFVHLKRSGANYKGLCPFHNDRTPSFHVSKAKNLCKCFSCGKGGNPVGFIMEHEQMSYHEALRYLAKKYNIEIAEREMTDEEREQESERESMLAINEFALNHFENNLTETQDGRDIGLTYFRERGLSDATIKKFRLGYSLEQSDALHKAATGQGYNDKYLFATGLCGKSENGRVYDRYKGRVIFPIFGTSGRPIAYGGRTLSSRKDVAKYVNSPESIIYHKSNVLYGLYQAKNAISRQDKCILVEGYMDVISMFQSGIENVVASSGTSLTEGQIRLIHRFTSNVTVIYDGDEAGIKASLRGIDMLLAEGLNIKVLLLPDGEDPDSFARSHTAEELAEYISQNETDFIRFKTAIMLKGAENDPQKRAEAIKAIMQSVAKIPDEITRHVYVQECSSLLNVTEQKLMSHMEVARTKYVEDKANEQRKEKARESIKDIDNKPDNNAPVLSTQQPDSIEENDKQFTAYAAYMKTYESEVVRYVVRYGVMDFCNEIDENGQQYPIKVIDYILRELNVDNITFTNSVYQRMLNEANTLYQENWHNDFAKHNETLIQQRQQAIADGIEEIRRTANDLSSITAKEQALIERVDKEYYDNIIEFNCQYIAKFMMYSQDDQVRTIATDMNIEKHELSKVHTKYAKIETEIDRLTELIPRAITELKDAIIGCEIKAIQQEISNLSSSPNADIERIMELMARQTELNEIKKQLAKVIGDRIITPRK